MKKYGKQFVVILLAAAALLALSVAFHSGSAAGALGRTLEKDWGPELPGGYTVEYRAATGADLEEGGLRFHVLLYDDSGELDGLLPWTDSRQPTGFAATGAEAAAEILTALGVPGGEWPRLETDGMWYATLEDRRELFLFHGEGDFRLYILESAPAPKETT